MFNDPQVIYLFNLSHLHLRRKLTVEEINFMLNDVKISYLESFILNLWYKDEDVLEKIEFQNCFLLTAIVLVLEENLKHKIGRFS